MRQETYIGQPASYAQYNSTLGAADNYSTRSTASSLNSINEQFPGTSSPDSQATEPSELVLTPNSGLTRFPLGIDYSPYLYQQQLESTPAASAFENAFITPDLSFPFQPAEVNSPNSATSSNWHSKGPQQFTWSPSNNSQAHNMINQDMQLNDQFPRQMPSEIYGASGFEFQHGVELESLGMNNYGTTASSSSETSSSLLIHDEPVQMNSNIEGYLGFDNGSFPNTPAPLGNPDETGKAKPEEPYAKLIQKALMSVDGSKMALQQIYQWFRENTDKSNNDGKGWQNSIRHNLSMNAAFLKCERGGTGDAKKSTVWQLAPFAIRDGVQSTTRYRKGNPARRNGSAAYNRSHGNTAARASSSRKSGISTSKNKSVDVRRSALTRATNSDLLHRHINPTIGPTNNQLLSYNYPNIPQPTMDHMNWIGHPNQAAVPPQSDFEFAAYTYNSSSHNEAMGGFSQGGYSQALYPAAEVAGAYEGSPLPAHPQGHNLDFAIPSSYNGIVSNHQESIEGNYMNWSSTPKGDSYA
ncbi:hypothetical protein F4782DRAFT_546344 [Xylaria castorea]|nr:hypothetical protein F4782DRAFT_546344 [Xylaria castorea]